LSLGATYYYFPSKEALVLAFYEANQAAAEAVAERATGSVKDRLGALLHGKLESIREHRNMLATIVQRLVDPGDPLSAFSKQTHAIRDRAITVFEKPLHDAKLSSEQARLAAHALWLFQLGAMLLAVHDDSPDQERTHGLIDDGLDAIAPILPMLATPAGAKICDRVLFALQRAGIAITPPA
jgi:AcrR family transcriptional regulator